MNTPIAKAFQQPVTTAFDPRTIPGCQLWLDAADITTLSITGSNVTQWNDKSSNGYNIITRTTAQYPVYVSNFNGTYPTVQGLGGAYMTTNAVIPTSNIQGPTGLSFFLLVSYQSGVVFVNYTPGERFISFEGSTRFDYGQPGVVYNTGTSFSSSQQLGFFVDVASRNLQLYQNGTLTVNANTINIITNTYTGRFTLFGQDGGAYLSAAKVSESIVFNRILSTSERQTVEGYLARKWGLTGNIPATHPFRSLPPMPRIFQPIDISGCTLWLDAADNTTFTYSGANITQWNDKSGNANHASNTTGTLLPTLGTSSVSLPAVDFNSAYLMNNNAFGLSNMSVFVVGEERVTNASNNYSGIIVFKGITGGPNAGTTEDYAQTNAILIATPSATETTTSIQVYSQLPPFPQLAGTGGNGYWTYRLYEVFIRTGTASEIFLNGTSNASYTLKNRSGNSAGYLLSARQFNGSFTVGRLKHSEVLSYDRVLTTSERQQVESYLANKWALRGNLASTHPFKLYNAVTPVFTPIQISGCSLWLDAADTNTLTLSGSNVSSWADKSGRSNNSTAVANPSPTWSSNLINGNLPAVWVSNSMIVGTLSNLAITGNQVHCFMLVNRLPADRDPYAWYLSLDDGANTGFGSTTGTSLQLNGNYQLAWCRNNVRGGGPGLNSNMSIINAYNSSSNTFIAANGGSFTLVNSGVTTNFNIQNWRVGGWQLSAQTPYWVPNFYVGEVIIYNSALSVNQYQQVEGYLAHKWGLSGSLPATHPYKKFIN